MTPLYNSKVAGKPQGSTFLTVFMMVLLVVVLAASFIFAFYKEDLISSPKARPLFKDALTQVCVAPADRLNYQGIHSFFQYLQQPYHSDCSSWTRLGNRTSVKQDEDENASESRAESDVTGWHYFCESEEKEMLRNPCLVYSFTEGELQEHFEEHFKSLGCSLHVFPQLVQEDLSADTELLKGPSYDVSDNSISSSTYRASVHPRDIQTLAQTRKSTAEGNSLQDLSLDAIASELGHDGERINLVSVEVPGQVWPVLAQLVRFHDVIDVHQLSAKIELPVDVLAMSEKEQHYYFSELHQVFEGMNCLGYKLIRSEPLTSKSNDLTILEVANERYPIAYQVNWMKVNN